MIQDVRVRRGRNMRAADFATIEPGLPTGEVRPCTCPRRENRGCSDLSIHHQAARTIRLQPRRIASCRSIGPEIAAWFLPAFFLIIILAATLPSGCTGGSAAFGRARRRKSFGRRCRCAKVPGAQAKPSNSSASVSHIEGDRMQSIPKAVMSKQTESSPFRFAEIAKEAGIDFVHFSGMTDDKHFPTANGSGVAVFDYDNDGLLDIYFATCTLLPLGTAEKGPNRLYKNLGGNHFKDVTESSGLGFRGFCHGIITGDIDNDGDQDVFLCNYGSNALYLNNGNGTFKDISKAGGNRRSELVVGRCHARLRQRRVSSTSMCRTTAAGNIPKTTTGPATPRRRSGCTRRPERSRPSSTSSSTITAITPSRTSMTR